MPHLSCLLLLCLLVLTGCPQFADDAQDAKNMTSATTNSMDPGPAAERECGRTIEFEGAQSATSVFVAGEFNDWDANATPLMRADGIWRAELMLEPGEYAYKFVIDGEYEGSPPPEVPSKWQGEIENRNLRVQDCSIPAFDVVESGVREGGEVFATLKFVSAVGGAKLDPESITLSMNRAPIEPARVDVERGIIEVSHKASAFGKHTLRADASDTQGRRIQDAPLWLPQWHEAEVFEWQDATMYLIFTDRFLDSDSTSPVPPIQGVEPIAGYMGGDFRGILQKIESGYFGAMGVNLLWLSPVYENTEQAWSGGDGTSMFTGYHGYWPIDPLTTESRYGDSEQSSDERLKQVIDAAHKRGIRVLFDVVHNHVHEDHIYCRENPAWCARTCTCGSQGCDWEGPAGKPLTCQFAPYLPDLSYRNHAILKRQVDDTVRLAEKFDVDGFRVDAAKHMDHIIMRALRERVHQLEAQGAAPFYTVGETFTGGDGYGLIMNYVADYELHGQFDFPLLYPIRDVFGKEGSFRGLEDAVVRSELAYGEAYKWMSPFLGNHDIPRFVTESLGNDWNPWDSSLDVMDQGPADGISDAQWNIINRLSMGFAFLLTQPGIPLMYYGDEVGLAGSGDPDNRRMMHWEWNPGQQELLERVRALGRARQDHKPLRRGVRTQLWVDDTLYVYARHTGPGEVVIVAMNRGAQRSEAVTIPAELGVTGESFESINSERTLQVNGTQATLALDSWEYAIFALPTSP